MTLLGLWLLVVGGCDLLRAARDATSSARRALIGGIGSVLLVFAGVLADPSVRGWLLVWLPAGVAFWLWVLGSAAALGDRRASGTRTDAVTGRAVAFAGLAGGLLVMLLGGGAGPADVSWPSALAGSPVAQWPVERVLLVTAVALVQISTVNIVVRLVLDAVGVPANANEKRLKGGRVLGPMERFVVVGLGMAGQLTAASIVVAAKGLLRFPELQRGSDDPGPSDVTEYFLIGSFTSWLAALGGLALVAAG
jgi:hypothetical protein